MRTLPNSLIAIFWLAGTAMVSAQQSSPADANQQQEQQVTEMAKQAYTRQVSELKYDDLPLDEIVKNLRKEFPEVNFILPEKLGQIIVRLELRNVNLSEILQAIQIACRNDHLRFEQANDRLVVFSLDESAAPPSEKPVLRAFNLSPYLAARPPAEQDQMMKQVQLLVEDAVRLLADAGRNVEMPRLQLHDGTRTLLVVGTSEQLNVLEEVVGNLPGMPSRAYRVGIATNPATGAPILPNTIPYATDPVTGTPINRLDERFLKRYGLGGGGGDNSSNRQ